MRVLIKLINNVLFLVTYIIFSPDMSHPKKVPYTNEATPESGCNQIRQLNYKVTKQTE